MDSKSLRIVFFADTHLGFDYPLRRTSDRRRRGQDFFDNYERVLSHALRVKADLVVHGGDFFYRSKVPRAIVDRAYERLVRFADAGIPIVIVPGNHERSVLPPSLFLSHSHIHVFDRPRTFRIETEGATVALSGFPNERDRIGGRFAALVAETGWQDVRADARLLCMHQTVEGATVGPNEFTFRRGADVVPRHALPRRFDGVLSGHIHRRQTLTGSHPPVLYPGSIERTSFAEKDEVKGFLELRVDPRRGAEIVSEFVPLPTRPMVEIMLPSRLDPGAIRSHLAARAAALDRDAVVRLTSDGVLARGALRLLLRDRLRSFFPPSVNVQLARNLFA